MGIDVPFMGADGWDSPTLVELAGAEALNNTFITNHYSSEDPDEKIQKFVKNFKDKIWRSHQMHLMHLVMILFTY